MKRPATFDPPADTGSFDRNGELDPAKGNIVTCVGKKRSGKSIMGLLYFYSYPQDRVVIDYAGDDGPMGPDIIELHGTVDELPTAWPEHLRRDDRGRPLPMTLRYVPDPGSKTVLEDMDAVVGLAMHHGDCAIMVHEMRRLAPSNRVPPHTRRLLDHNRHQRVTGIFCAPRARTMDPLVIGQSDLVYVFELPSSYDQEMIAGICGWRTDDFAAAVDELGAHEHLRFDSNMGKPERPDDEDYRLVHCPALPPDVVAEVTHWAHGNLPPGRTPDELDADREHLELTRGRR